VKRSDVIATVVAILIGALISALGGCTPSDLGLVPPQPCVTVMTGCNTSPPPIVEPPLLLEKR
jgi:hypothetical protein